MFLLRRQLDVLSVTIMKELFIAAGAICVALVLFLPSKSRSKQNQSFRLAETATNCSLRVLILHSCSFFIYKM